MVEPAGRKPDPQRRTCTRPSRPQTRRGLPIRQWTLRSDGFVARPGMRSGGVAPSGLPWPMVRSGQQRWHRGSGRYVSGNGRCWR